MKIAFDNEKIKKIEKGLRTYDDQGKHYLVNYYIPGITFSESERMRVWGKRHIIAFDEIIAKKDECLFCSYSLCGRDGTVIYYGSSIKPFSRSLIHIANIMNNPSDWGLTFADLDNPGFVLSVHVHGNKCFDERARKSRECAELAVVKSALQKSDGTSDELIPLKARRAAMKAAGII